MIGFTYTAQSDCSFSLNFLAEYMYDEVIYAGLVPHQPVNRDPACVVGGFRKSA